MATCAARAASTHHPGAAHEARAAKWLAAFRGDSSLGMARDGTPGRSPVPWNLAAASGGGEGDGDAWDGLPALPSSPKIEGTLSGVRVLVVEDDTDIRELLTAVLEDAGALVESAESAASGLDAVRDFHPQLLVSDIGMPDEDGYSFIRRVRALGADGGGDVPSIALTAFTSPNDRNKALRAGFTLHLGKPIDPFDLVCAAKGLVSAQGG